MHTFVSRWKAGKGMTADLLKETLSTMAEGQQFRQVLVCLEPCYSANMCEALTGIPGVLAICSSGPYEQSFADTWAYTITRTSATSIPQDRRISSSRKNSPTRRRPEASHKD